MSAVDLSHLLVESKAHSAARDLLEWISAPLRKRLESEVSAGAERLTVSLVEHRLLFAVHSVGCHVQDLPEPQEGDTYMGVLLGVSETPPAP